MAQWVKCLLCKRENLSLEPGYIKRSIKTIQKGSTGCTLSWVGQRQEDSLRSLASESS